MAPLKISKFLKLCVLAILLGVMPFAVTLSLAQDAQTATDRLFQAVRNNDLGMAQTSVAAGGDVNATNAAGITPVDMAVDKGFFDIAHFLLSIRNQEQFSETPKPLGLKSPVPVESVAAPSPPLLRAPPPAVKTDEPAAWPKGKPNPFDPDAPPAISSPPIIGVGPETSSPPITQPGDDLPEGVAFGPAATAGTEETKAAPMEEEKPAGFLQDITNFFSPDDPPPEETLKDEPATTEVGMVESVEDPVPENLEPPPPVIPIDPGEAALASPLQKEQPGETVRELDSDEDGSDSPVSRFFNRMSDLLSPDAGPEETASVEEGRSEPLEIKTEKLSAEEEPSPRSLPAAPDETAVTEKTDEAPTAEQQIATVEDAEPDSNSSFFDEITQFFSSDEESPEAEAMAPKEESIAKTDPQDLRPELDTPSALAVPPRSTVLPPPVKEEPLKEPSMEAPGPDEDAKEDRVKGLLDKLTGFFKGDETNTDGENEETATAPDTAPEDQWAVKKVQKAEKPKTPPPPPGKKDPKKPKAQYLKGNVLALGRSLKLGRLLKGRAEPGKSCIEKNRDEVSFCIDSVDWPDSMREYFDISSVLYNGPKAIARYDGNAATNFHALFPSTAFGEIVAYYTKRYGKPTFNITRSIAPLAQPRQENPTVIWRSADSLTKQFTSLEIRKFDDSRGGFPDTRRGAVMLYRQWSQPIFPHLSTIELMILNSNS